MSECFSDYFINIGNIISENIKNPQTLDMVNSNNLFLIPVTKIELIHRIGCICVKNMLLSPFHKIMETSIEPLQFKESIVVPMYKLGYHNEITNYHLLNNFDTIFEKCLNKRLRSYFEKYKIVSDKQFGFQKKECTECAKQLLISSILGNFQKNKKTIRLFLDLVPLIIKN